MKITLNQDSNKDYNNLCHLTLRKIVQLFIK